MLHFSLFIIELLALFLLSRTLTNLLFAFFYKTTRSKKISIYLLSFLFLPGTIIHEISHAIMATLLQVHVGRMEFIPKIDGNNLKMGSVEVGHTDPIRRILIGIAPFLLGTTIILCAFFYAAQNNLFVHQLIVIIMSYLIFEIGNTMFSSKKDLEGALGIIIMLIFICVVFYIVGFRLTALSPQTLFANPLITETLQNASTYMLSPLVIDLALITVLKLIKI